jgi:hypothetical protein
LIDVALHLTLSGVLGRKKLLKKIYVVKKGNTVVYVGMAGIQSVATRIAIHITASTYDKPRSKFAQLLSDAHPDYFDWRVEVLSQRECQAVVGHKLLSLREAERAMYLHYRDAQGDISGNAKRP